MGTHFGSGVTNVYATDESAILKTMDPSVYYVYENDFLNFTAAQWIATVVGTGAGAVADGAGGLLAIVNSAANADATQYQFAGSDSAAHLQIYWDSTKQFYMKARYKIDHATNGAFLIGAATIDTTVVASLPTDGIYFYKAAASTALLASTRKSGTSSSVTLNSTMANDTFVTSSISYDPTTGVWSTFYNGAPVGQITSTTNSPTNGLCISLGCLNGTAAARTLTVDYLNVLVQR